MKKFYFRLQKVLDVNEIREENARRHFADAERARGLQCDNLNAAESAVSSQRVLFRDSLTKGIKAGDALVNHRFGQRLQRQVGEEKRKLQHAEEVVSDRLKDLTEAARRKKMLEILKEKEIEKHRLEVTLAESNEQDEVAGRRYTAALRMKEIDG